MRVGVEPRQSSRKVLAKSSDFHLVRRDRLILVNRQTIKEIGLKSDELSASLLFSFPFIKYADSYSW
jgi:hypothetical protein